MNQLIYIFITTIYLLFQNVLMEGSNYVSFTPMCLPLSNCRFLSTSETIKYFSLGSSPFSNDDIDTELLKCIHIRSSCGYLSLTKVDGYGLRKITPRSGIKIGLGIDVNLLKEDEIKDSNPLSQEIYQKILPFKTNSPDEAYNLLSKNSSILILDTNFILRKNEAFLRKKYIKVLLDYLNKIYLANRCENCLADFNSLPIQVKSSMVSLIYSIERKDYFNDILKDVYISFYNNNWKMLSNSIWDLDKNYFTTLHRILLTSHLQSLSAIVKKKDTYICFMVQPTGNVNNEQFIFDHIYNFSKTILDDSNPYSNYTFPSFNSVVDIEVQFNNNSITNIFHSDKTTDILDKPNLYSKYLLATSNSTNSSSSKDVKTKTNLCSFENINNVNITKTEDPLFNPNYLINKLFVLYTNRLRGNQYVLNKDDLNPLRKFGVNLLIFNFNNNPNEKSNWNQRLFDSSFENYYFASQNNLSSYTNFEWITQNQVRSITNTTDDLYYRNYWSKLYNNTNYYEIKRFKGRYTVLFITIFSSIFSDDNDSFSVYASKWNPFPSKNSFSWFKHMNKSINTIIGDVSESYEELNFAKNNSELARVDDMSIFETTQEKFGLYETIYISISSNQNLTLYTIGFSECNPLDDPYCQDGYTEYFPKENKFTLYNIYNSNLETVITTFTFMISICIVTLVISLVIIIALIEKAKKSDQVESKKVTDESAIINESVEKVDKIEQIEQSLIK